MVAIRICPWCKSVWDAIVGVDGVYCSPVCESQALAAKQCVANEVAGISPETTTGEFFDDFPGLSDDEFEEAMVLLRQRNRAKWR